MIKAPYNFVPLSDKVFFPSWADQISHDIPFEDGVSGCIDIEITAETPIFVRNGHNKKDAELKNKDYESFSVAPDGRYFLPSTSIKGCVRNALEILSFCKMGHIDNKRYSIRDLQLKNYISRFQQTDIHCGWMYVKDNKIVITDNGIPRRISLETIDQKYQTDFLSFVLDKNNFTKDELKTAKHKYSMFGSNSLCNTFAEFKLSDSNAVDTRIAVRFSDNGIPGTIVFTGQPGVRKPKEGDKKASGKIWEFVFFDKIENSFSLDQYEENGLYEDFCFIYKDSEDWAYWRKKMDKGEKVPVFMSVKNNKLEHFGLSYLYRLPYPERVKGYLPDAHQSQKCDLADCIFGYTSKSKSLKGRVQFSNAFCDKGERLNKVLRPYMGSPKPTYYPAYIQQGGEVGYMEKNGEFVWFSTMLDENAKLRGWKRYPVHEEEVSDFVVPVGQDDNTNPFIPLNKGSVFKGKVIFHNLKRAELGALLYAIKLREGHSWHSIGFAKPFGYGRISIKADVEGLSYNELYNEFVAAISKDIENYSNQPQIQEFMLMAAPQKLKTGNSLEYMELSEFVSNKKQHPKQDRNYTTGNYLQPYSEMIEKKVAENVVVNVLATAKVVLFDGRFKQARLTDGKDANQKFDIEGVEKVKLKVGDIIEVEKVSKDGRVKKIIFKRKI